MPTLLIANADSRLLETLHRLFTAEGYQVLTALDGPAALALTEALRPDLVLLDARLSGLDSLEVVRRVRAQDSLPILVLMAGDAVEDRIEALDAGADDCLGQPFRPAELMARLRALLRRAEGCPCRVPTLSFADLRLDPVSREGQRGGRRFTLTPTEFDLLHYLLRHPREVLPRDKLLEEVWGYDFGGQSKTLEVYIGYLRAKTEADGEPRLIQTVHGVGYVLREEG